MSIKQRENFFNDSGLLFLKEKIQKVANFSVEDCQKTEEVVIPNTLSKFSIGPLQRGRGILLGNSLRRTLLSSIDGYAVAAVKSPGVNQIFDTISGIREDFLEITLNIKEVAIRCTGNQKENSFCEMVLFFDKEGDIFAGDIRCTAGFEVVNPNHFICYSDGSAKGRINMFVTKGCGYVQAEEYTQDTGEDFYQGEPFLFIDSIFNPVQRVAFSVEPQRVGQKFDCEKLMLEIETNGASSPKVVLEQAVEKILRLFAHVSEESAVLKTLNAKGGGDSQDLPFDQIFYQSVEILGLPERASKKLEKLNIHRIGDLVTMKENTFLQIDNVGLVTHRQVKNILAQHNLSLNMTLEGWKPLENPKENIRSKFINNHYNRPGMFFSPGVGPGQNPI